MAAVGGPSLGARAVGRYPAKCGAAVDIRLCRSDEDAKPLGASAVARAHQVLSVILADAVRDRLIAANPATGIKLPRQVRKRPGDPTHRQVADLAAAAGNHEALVLLLADRRLRWGEAVALRVADLDMLQRRATVSESAFQVGAQKEYTVALRRTSSAACRCPSSCCRTWLGSAKGKDLDG